MNKLFHKADMFRITKIYENNLTSIIKIEGEISDENVLDWKNEISRLTKLPEREIIFEICYVTFIVSQSRGSPNKTAYKEDFFVELPNFCKQYAAFCWFVCECVGLMR